VTGQGSDKGQGTRDKGQGARTRGGQDKGVTRDKGQGSDKGQGTRTRE